MFKSKKKKRFQVYFPDNLREIWNGTDGERWRKEDVSHRLSVKAVARADIMLKNINAKLLLATLMFVIMTTIYSVYGLFFKQFDETYFVDGSPLVCTIDKNGMVVPKAMLDPNRKSLQTQTNSTNGDKQ